MNDEVKIISSIENWSEYKLEDGTIIKLKPVVTKIIKTDKKKSDGTPVYSVTFQPVIDYYKE